MSYSTALPIGRRRTGKTTYIVQSALDCIHDGAPIALFDPYGTAAKLVLPRIPEGRWNDVVPVEPDRDFPVAFNPLYNIHEEDFSRTIATMKHTLKGCWDYTTFATPTLDDILAHGIGAVLYSRCPSLVSLKWFLTDAKRRARVLGTVRDIGIEDYWKNDFERMNDRQQVDETRSTLSKVRAFTSDPYTRNILGQSVSRINMKDVLKNKILIVNVSISEMGIETSRLLGSLLMAELHQAALSHEGRFFCYVDGADRFAQSVQVEMAEMTSGASYLFSVTHLGQIGERFRKALAGASDALMSFTVGIEDSLLLQPVFLSGENETIEKKLHELRRFEMCVSEIGCGPRWEPSPDLTFPLIRGAVDQVRHMSREKYTRQRSVVEKELKRFVRGT